MTYQKAFLILVAYIIITRYIVQLFKKQIKHHGTVFQILSISFLYALFWGIYIVSNGPGNPGFAIPTPNLLIIIYRIIFYGIQSISSNLISILIWWLIFIFLLGLLNIYNKYFSEKSNKQTPNN